MIYWVDAQLPPQLAKWLSDTFNVEAYTMGYKLSSGINLKSLLLSV